MFAMDEMLSPYNLAFLEGLYRDYVSDPGSVPADYRDYFAKLKSGNGNGAAFRTAPSFPRRSLFDSDGSVRAEAATPLPAIDQALLQERVALLIRNYRVRGHNIARVDPLDRPRPESPEL